MSDKLERISSIQGAVKRNSMEVPPANVLARVEELIAMNPRIAYPFMEESEFQAMMEAREKKT